MFEHDFDCPSCGVALIEPTQRSALREGWDGTLVGLVEEYGHPCGSAFARPFVLSPFPDFAQELHRRVRVAFPPIERAA